MRTLVGIAIAVLLAGGLAQAQQDVSVESEGAPVDLGPPAMEPELAEEPQPENGVGGTGAQDASPAQLQASPDVPQPPLRSLQDLPRESDTPQVDQQAALQAAEQAERQARQEADLNLPARGPELPSPTIQGRIVNVDPKQGSVTIRDEATRTDFVLEVQDTTPVQLAGRAVPLQSLARGADVRASYFAIGDTLVAQELVAQPGAPQRQRPDAEPSNRPRQQQQPPQTDGSEQEPAIR